MAADILNNINIPSQKRQEQVSYFNACLLLNWTIFFPWNHGEKWSFGLLASLHVKESNFVRFVCFVLHQWWANPLADYINYIDVDKNISVVSSIHKCPVSVPASNSMEYHFPDAYKTYVNRICSLFTNILAIYYNYIFTVYFLASIIQFKPPNEIVQKLNYSANV